MTFEEYDKVTEIVLGLSCKCIQQIHGEFGQGYEACRKDVIDGLTSKLWPYIDKEDLENGKNG